jgi:hypothetical protein
MKILDSFVGGSNWQAWCAGADLQDRGPRITALEASIIAGNSPLQTPHGLWMEMLGRAVKKQSGQAAQRRIELEHLARVAYEADFGESLPARCIESNESWIGANLDGLSAMADRALMIVLPNEKTHLSAIGGVIPPHYTDHIQWMMRASDGAIEEVRYVSFRPEFLDQPLACVTVKENVTRQTELYEMVKRFREAVMAGIPVTGDKFAQIGRAWLVLNRRQKAITLQMDKLKDELTEISPKGGAGGGVSLIEATSQGAVKWESLARALAKTHGVAEADLEVAIKFHTGAARTGLTLKEGVDAESELALIDGHGTSEASVYRVSTPPEIAKSEQPINDLSWAVGM